jgi:hypothetical protein
LLEPGRERWAVKMPAEADAGNVEHHSARAVVEQARFGEAAREALSQVAYPPAWKCVIPATTT